MGREIWQERAGLPDLRPVLDPADKSGVKNLYIDQLHRNALARDLDLAPGQRILDLGCGIGRLSTWLAGTDRTVVGVDISMAMLAAARRHPHSRVSFVHFGGAELPFGDQSFDRVVSVFVLQHVVEDTELDQLLAGVARVTRVGGRLAVIEQVRRGTGFKSTYVRHRSLEAYRQAFTRAGFSPRRLTAVRARLGLSPLAARGLLPRSAWRSSFRFDSWLAGPASRFSYADCLMVFDRVAAA